MNELRIVRALAPLLDGYRARIAILVALGAIAGLCEGVGVSLMLPLLASLDATESIESGGGTLGRWLGALFDGVDSDARVRVVLFAMFGLLVAKALLSAVNGLLFARLDARLVDDLRRRVLDQALRVELGFVERRRTGDVIALLQNQTWEASAAVAMLVGIAVRLVTVTVFGLALLLISWRLTLGVAVFLLVISWVVRRIGRRVDRLSEVGLARWNDLSQRCVEVLRGLRTTRAFGREDFERERFARTSAATSEAFWNVERLRALVDPLSEIMVAALLAAVLLASIGDAARLPAALTFLFILFRLQPQVQRLDSARVRLAASGAAVRVLTEFVDDEGKPYLRDGTRVFERLREGVDLDGVSYRYPGQAGDDRALAGVTATIPARSTTAVVGPSGAGKSTLVHLLMRFADPLSGTIRIDGVPLTDLVIETWRAGIALVSQSAHVFHGSVADNIRYGREGATDAEVREAARRAHADAFIAALPDGYDTLLGEDGVGLSGGQRQRIALARALVRDAGILVLDEATNALDAIAESVIQDALAELAGTHTMIVIAHRFSTIEKADHVIVLDDGALAEEGPRAELLTDGGLFTRLHELQIRTAP